MLATHADLQVRSRGATFLHRDVDEPADPVAVDRLERRNPEDAKVEVPREERTLHVVAREAPAHLGEVVRTEREELGRLGDLPRGQRGARYLDHRADQRVYVDAGLLRD